MRNQVPTFDELVNDDMPDAALSLLTLEYAELLEQLKRLRDYDAAFEHMGNSAFALVIPNVHIDGTLSVRMVITDGHGTITPWTTSFNVTAHDADTGEELADAVDDGVFGGIDAVLDELIIAPEKARTIFWKTTMTSGALYEGVQCSFESRFDTEKSTKKPVEPNRVNYIEGLFWKLSYNEEREWYVYLKDGSANGYKQAHQGFPAADLVDGITVQMIADVMKLEIADDIRDGAVPETVTTFSDLHDHVDANMYADSLQSAHEGLSGQSYLDYINDVTDIVDAWLRTGRK